MAKFILYTNPHIESDLFRDYLTNRGIEFEERDLSKGDKGKTYQDEILALGYYYPPVLLKEFEEADGTNGLKRTTVAGFNIMAIDKMLDFIV